MAEFENKVVLITGAGQGKYSQRAKRATGCQIKF